MRVGSTFSGVGGLDLGLERAGMRTVWQCEKDEYRRRVLARHWPDIERWDDIGSLQPDTIRQFVGRRPAEGILESSRSRQRTSGSTGGEQAAIDLLCGGFPCQDLSVAGRRKGLEGDRSGLFYEFARIADELRPRWLMVENVPGLLSSADGRDFAIVLRTLADIGYGLAWRVLDARYFGVPQRRRRVFIVGHLGGDPGPAVLALGAGGEGDFEAGRCSWQGSTNGTSGSVAPTLGQSYGARGVDLEAPHVVARALTTSQERNGDGFDQDFVVSALDRQAGGPDDNSAQAGHLVMAVSENQRAEVLETPIARQLTSGGGKPGQGYSAVREANGVRRLTPTECERLMSWPDGWTLADEKTADSRRYAACGDGVVSNVAEWIGRRIMAVDERSAG
jgi:DNA (cytosine-5)-methyltransferase 1